MHGGIVAAALLCLLAAPAHAYIGPGAGLGMVAAFWALLTAVLGALAFLIAWPVRRILRRGRNGNRLDHAAPGE